MVTRVFRAAGWALAGLLTFLSLWWGPDLALNAIEPAAQAVGVVVFGVGLVAFAHLYAKAWWVTESWWQNRIRPRPDAFAHIKIGDPDPFARLPDRPVCEQQNAEFYRCTRDPGHIGAHIAGTGEEVVAVWATLGGAP